MLNEIVVFFSILVSSWNIYNSALSFYGLTWRVNQKIEYSDKTFSILVPAKNEEKVLGRLLDRLINQEYDKSKYEIIVVEDGSTDRTFQICKNYEENYDNVRCVKLDKSNVPNGKSRALNYAMKLAKFDIIGVFDADTFPRLDVLSYVSGSFDSDNVVAVQGKLIPINVRESIIARFASLEELFNEYSIGGRARFGLFVPLEGTCTFVKKSIIEEMGGWNEYSLTEDLDLSVKLTSAGYKIMYNPNVVAWREVASSLRWLIKQRLRWYRGHFEISLSMPKKIDPRIFDGILLIGTPIFMLMNLVNYSLVLIYQTPLFVVTMVIVSTATLLSFITAVGISRKHLIEYQYSILSLIYMNFVMLLNVTAVFLEIVRVPRVWIKTERSGKISVPEV
ncbi:glycosyltransferase [Sulfolobus acidocaldarius]|uniref:N-acetylglucosaminyltransferase n=4 Tax=Sulfolobus acidocaldarius TaxID=2285 RepID=Q4JBY8_SULAC|nr:glycosyltransferase family 2 protein [Sulfolobus acidocaldarius]AAY79691.1 N-acetylglucosaminyltransferase [Sulfolobus acidocaldarius DSM 639]AGE70250.1 N-acetylglucosaminyltransferase [Sulfolobus acidocaldarius N8]AGE72525.1 N-acetylglucosaminyltransferase [Sulfolobus acidocaldarius Ron12/I]ALU29346.1 glycosyl transferase family 2 [Sulfolobus acidocaldarius]ALU32075.1 glycosyl transferase family 2 [Sulfolobus acidocaldarius]